MNQRLDHLTASTTGNWGRAPPKMISNYRFAFAGQPGLGKRQPSDLDQLTIRQDTPTGREHDQVAGDQFAQVHLPPLSDLESIESSLASLTESVIQGVT